MVAYAITLGVCIIVDAPLIGNSNRAGNYPINYPYCRPHLTEKDFHRLYSPRSISNHIPFRHQEFSTFVSSWTRKWIWEIELYSLLVWSSYVYRCLSSWIFRNHLQYNLPIFGQRKETSGVASLGLLGVLVISSLKPVRRLYYQVFTVIQYVSQTVLCSQFISWWFYLVSLDLLLSSHSLCFAVDLPSVSFLQSRYRGSMHEERKKQWRAG